MDNQQKNKVMGIMWAIIGIIASVGAFSFTAPLLFSAIANLYDPIPKIDRECQVVFEEPIRNYIECMQNSQSYHAKVWRLKYSIPWAGIALIGFFFLFLRNLLRGGSPTKIESKPQTIFLEIIATILVQLTLCAAVYVFFARNLLSISIFLTFISLLIGVLFYSPKIHDTLEKSDKEI